MSNVQSYALLENGEDPAAEPEDLASTLPISKSRRHFLESVQSLKTHFHYVEERMHHTRQKLPEWLRPVCSLWLCMFILAAMLIALVLALVTTGVLGSTHTGEDMLQYIDPLIGTGPGGTATEQCPEYCGQD